MKVSPAKIGADGRVDAALAVREGPTTAAASPAGFAACSDFGAELNRRGELRLAGGWECEGAALLEDVWLASPAADDADADAAAADDDDWGAAADGSPAPFSTAAADDTGAEAVIGFLSLPLTRRFPPLLELGVAAEAVGVCGGWGNAAGGA
jgi:hypothetical protein